MLSQTKNRPTSMKKSMESLTKVLSRTQNRSTPVQKQGISNKSVISTPKSTQNISKNRFLSSNCLHKRFTARKIVDQILQESVFDIKIDPKPPFFDIFRISKKHIFTHLPRQPISKTPKNQFSRSLNTCQF